MPIVDLYSSRTTEQQRTGDVWVYDEIPDVLRVQVANLVKGAMGTANEYARDNARGIYDFIQSTVAHEHGRDFLAHERFAAQDVYTCIRREGDLRVWLDVVELSF